MNFSSYAKCTPGSVVKRWVSVTIAGAILTGALPAFAGVSGTPVGVWQTMDDQTQQPTALVQIAQNGDGTISGKIIKGLGANDSPERRCVKCTDERKDQKIQGMTVVRGMRQQGDEWDGGKILDPISGNEYSCKMRLEAGGQKLVVRGYIGVSLLGRSQTWIRHGDVVEPGAQN
ncbi:DUF2147 domain-containing protein [Burkholderia sp. Ac-20353]|uniref:DUF2147 domain-containing protein n=1 Tax=Burkholderia sp. Ac-20353 TaxID=2703894 RepID=UPI00197BA2FD|nr:DUF2147 domain-containing protein [Burkholderia sp. Ac-20353]MBN3785620.1 DUF2147 domain-containing protein [Burkholderia sp. Ac-20353]